MLQFFLENSWITVPSLLPVNILTLVQARLDSLIPWLLVDGLDDIVKKTWDLLSPSGTSDRRLARKLLAVKRELQNGEWRGEKKSWKNIINFCRKLLFLKLQLKIGLYHLLRGRIVTYRNKECWIITLGPGMK